MSSSLGGIQTSDGRGLSTTVTHLFTSASIVLPSSKRRDKVEIGHNTVRRNSPIRASIVRAVRRRMFESLVVYLCPMPQMLQMSELHIELIANLKHLHASRSRLHQNMTSSDVYTLSKAFYTSSMVPAGSSSSCSS